MVQHMKSLRNDTITFTGVVKVLDLDYMKYKLLHYFTSSLSMCFEALRNE